LTYAGTLQGISTLQGTLIVHRDGSASFQGMETFNGLVDGIPDTLTFKLEGSSDLYQAIEINNIITSDTGELSNLQDQISEVGIIKDNGPVDTIRGKPAISRSLLVVESERRIMKITNYVCL
jgi:hypothetical protein